MNEPDDNTPDHDEEDDAPTPAPAPAPRKPHLLDRLRDALSSQKDQLARAQQQAEAEEARLEALTREHTNLEGDRVSAREAIEKLDAEHQRLVEGRPGWLESCRANWRDRNYSGSMMAEMDFAIADYPEHRALLVERLGAVEAAIKTFKRQHGV